MSKVVIIKTLAGEELLATENETLSGVTYSKVRMFQYGDGNAGLIPWMLTSPDSEIKFAANALACQPVEAPLDIERSYMKATSSILLG